MSTDRENDAYEAAERSEMNEDRRNAAYVCPQCGPDPAGAWEHSQTHHVWHGSDGHNHSICEEQISDIRAMAEAEVSRLTQERDEARDEAELARVARAQWAQMLREERRATEGFGEVVEAAKAWRACTNPELVSEIDALGAVDALIAAVDALPKES